MALNASNLPCLVSGKRLGLFCRKYDACEFTDGFSDFCGFFYFFVSCFPVEREYAERPYAILRATRQVICDPVTK